MYNSYRCICHAVYVGTCYCFCAFCMYDVLILSSTGALRELEECNKVAIQKAIDQKCWDAASFLLDQASTGKS